jgi:AGZA family xanthine/uracil permease-like MFS transporter
MLPNIANWAQSQIDGALSAAGTSAKAIGMAKLGMNGVVYHGMALFGGGATLAGLILGAMAAFVIDRKFDKAAIYAFIGAVLAFFGFINGTALGFANSPGVALGYAVIGVFFLAMTRMPVSAEHPTLEEVMHAAEPAE